MYRHAIAIVAGAATLGGVGVGIGRPHPTFTSVLGPATTIRERDSRTLTQICPNHSGAGGGGTTNLASDQGAILSASTPVYDNKGLVVGWSITVYNPTQRDIIAQVEAVCSA